MSMNIGPVPTSQDYDYSSSGIDNFLGRSLDQVSWQTTLNAMLNMPGNESLTTLPTQSNGNQMNYDSAMVTGSLGNTLQASSNIVTVDNNGNQTVQIGTLS